MLAPCVAVRENKTARSCKSRRVKVIVAKSFLFDLGGYGNRSESEFPCIAPTSTEHAVREEDTGKKHQS